ncbi:hypothetical protein ACIGO8_16420 [Streptomyces sp. NPDC053493]|uniref:hypothetical protein n=1 Tax=Streptomyces sp. NPDC053493 TaxID=3365705 RepID=UPI0037D43BE3
MLIAVTVLPSCTVEAPDPPDFGFRWAGGGLVVAAPLCPSESVDQARVSVPSAADGRGDGFDTLWSAGGPVTDEARGGTFSVGSSTSFRNVEKPLSGALPDEFYVEIRLAEPGRTAEGRDGTVDLTKLKGTRLRDGEFMTWTGKVLTRGQLDAQLRCGD